MRKNYNGSANKPLWRKVYAAWRDIKIRCHDTSSKFYKDYGGRGIGIDPCWETDLAAFYDYVSRLDGFCKEVSIDRKDNDGCYSPGNVQWSSKSAQVQNRRKARNNTSGVNGVTWYFNATGGTRAIAWWEDLTGNTCSKSFSVKKHGLLPAFALAVSERADRVANLNKLGTNYSEKHGK